MTNQPEATAATPSDVVGERIRELRRHRRLSVDELAAACAKVGMPELTSQAIYNIESGRRVDGRRRRTISVDELWAFATALDVPLSSLLWPLINRDPEAGAALLRFTPRELHLFIARVQEAAKLLPATQEGSE